MMEWTPIILTFKLAIITAFCLLIISIPIVYLLLRLPKKIAMLVNIIIALPLVLPPTVIGFYLLVFLSPHNKLGMFIESIFGIELLFSFPGLVIGSIIYSLPFMVHPILSAAKAIPINLIESAYVLGKGKWNTFRYVIMPNAYSGVLIGIVLSFAHTIGEFGVVLMIGGNIPGKTKVASVAIFEKVELMDYQIANNYALVLMSISFLLLLLLYSVKGIPFKSDRHA